MKKGFTLVEMLIVVVILVTLMAVTFRLTSIGADQSYRNVTVARLQKLENCLSGYYAAFGTYPPVRLHGSRNYLLKTSSHGIQNLNGEEEPLQWNWYDVNEHKVSNDDSESRDWRKVEAACKSQPVDCRYPFPQTPEWEKYAQSVWIELARKASTSSSLSPEKKAIFGGGVTVNISGLLSPYQDRTEWRDVQIFKFGLMSFLLPRYLVMMRSDAALYRDHAQWLDNNKLPCDPLTGRSYGTWDRLQRKAVSEDATDIAEVANIPSQAVCSRWMANLAGTCSYSDADPIFGIDIRGDDVENSTAIPVSFNLEVFTPGGYDENQGQNTSGQYLLDGVTVRDGWRNEFYYYSPAPHQTYVLWSAGPNKRTFPPWVSRESLDQKARQCVGYWTEDDIVNLSH